MPPTPPVLTDQRVLGAFHPLGRLVEGEFGPARQRLGRPGEVVQDVGAGPLHGQPQRQQQQQRLPLLCGAKAMGVIILIR